MRRLSVTIGSECFFYRQKCIIFVVESLSFNIVISDQRLFRHRIRLSRRCLFCGEIEINDNFLGFFKEFRARPKNKELIESMDGANVPATVECRIHRPSID